MTEKCNKKTKKGKAKNDKTQTKIWMKNSKAIKEID